MSLVKITDAEIGATGTKIYGGEVWNTEDCNPDFHSQAGMALLEEMRTSDGDIDGCIMRMTWPLVSATWDTQPYASNPDGTPSEADKKRAKMIKTMMFERDIEGVPHEVSFESFIEQTVSLMLAFGHCAWEKVWGTDREGNQIIAKFALRHPKATFRFMLDEKNNLEALEQYVYTYSGFERKVIPADKLLLFTLRREGDNYWGRSILRSSYRSFVALRELGTIDSMRHELAGRGLPVLYGPAGGGDAANLLGKKMMRELRAHERQYMFFPEAVENGVKKWLFELIQPTGTGTDIPGSMQMWKETMMRALLNDFSMLGMTESGTKNLGADKTNFFLMALQAIVKIVSSGLRAQVFVPVCEQNEKGSGQFAPFLVCEDLDEQSLTDMAKAMGDLKTANVLTPDDSIEDYVRAKAKWPKRDPNSARATPAPLPGPQNNGQPGSGDGEDVPSKAAAPPDEPSGKPAPPKASTRTAVIRAIEMRREPMPHETACNFAEMKAMFDTVPEELYKQDVKPVRREQIKKIAAAVVDTLSKKEIRKPLVGKIADDVFSGLKKVYMQGRASIGDERRKQLGGAEPSRPDTASDVVVTGAVSQIYEASKKELLKIKMLADRFAEDTTEALIDRALNVAMVSRLAGLSDIEIEERVLRALNDMSDNVVVSDLEGKVISSFTSGRNDAAEAVKDEITTAFYSAIMDEGTCVPCESLDGQEHEPGSDDFATPNPNCDWPPHCRCVTVYVFKRD